MKYKFSPLALFLSSIVFPLFVVSSVSAKSEIECKKSADKISTAWKKEQGNKLSPSEKFAWTELCQEKEGGVDIRWKTDRVLSFKFLKAILTNETYNKELPTRIIIKGAIFNDKIDLVSENINKEVNLNNSTFTKVVDLSNSTFSKSVNFDNSEFNQSLIFNDAIVKGSLSFNDVKFTLKNLDQCRNLLNLQRIQVEGDLKIIKTVFSCSNPNLRELIATRAKEPDSNYLIDLNAAKIKVSVYLEEISLVIDTRTDEIETYFHFHLGVGLVGAEIGDAVFINQTNVEHKQIKIINMSNIKARALVSFVDDSLEKKIKDYRIFKLFNGDKSKSGTLEAKRYLSQLIINLENANINIINIIGKKNQGGGQNNNNNNNDDSPACKFNLEGFNYNQLNTTAYKILTICIDSLYQEAINSADQIGKQEKVINFTNQIDKQREKENKWGQQAKVNEKANNQLVQLLQPIEKLSMVSKNLGVYAVEQEMMYRQKKLDYYLTKTNLDNSVSSFSEALYPINLETLGVEFVRTLSLSSALVSNIFQDITSGYGFHRLRIFNFIIPILILNFFLALFVSYQKQKKIAHYSLYFKTREIEDENIRDRLTINKKTYCFKEISDEIDTIQQIIFGGCRLPYFSLTFNVGLRILQTDYLIGCIFISQALNNQNLIFLLYLKNKKDKYKKIELDCKEFKYIINILDSRNPTHSKVGFCKDYYPRGSWSVVINPQSLSDVEGMKEVDEIDLYFIDRQQIIKGMQFKSINPIKSFLNAIRFLVKPLTKRLNILLEAFDPSLNDRLKIWMYYRDKDSFLIKLLTNKSSFGDFFLLVEIVIIIIVKCLGIAAIFFLSTLPCVRFIISFLSKIITTISQYQVPIYSLILLFLISEVFRFWLRRKVIQKKIGLALVTQKNLENALLFCIDILIPIIELDKDNMEFILDAAEDHQIIRMFFRFEKVIGPLLISVLLPLILLT